jgi:cell division septation protein DedD
MQFENLIKDLLYTNDCVVLPGLGGFIAKYKGATLNSNLHTIYPPQKNIGFNPQIKENDGLLISALCALKNCSYADGKIELESWIREQSNTLIRGEKISWKGIGVLFQDRLGKIQFIPDSKGNFSLESFGLEKIILVPVEREIQEPAAAEVSVLEKRAAQGSKWIWKAAAVLALPILGVGIFALSHKIESTDWQYASFKLFGTKSRIAEYTPAVTRTIPTYSVTEDTEIAPPAPVIIEKTQTISPTPRVEPVVVASVEPIVADSVCKKKYEIIVGAFAVSENAERLVRDLKKKGFNASLSSKKGELQLVSSWSNDSYEVAVQQLEQAKSKISSASWLKEN